MTKIRFKWTDGEIEGSDMMQMVSPKVQEWGDIVELNTSRVKEIKWILEYFERHNYAIPAVLPKPLRSNLIADLVDDDEDNIQELSLSDKRDLLNAFDELQIWNWVELFCAAIASDFRRKDLKDIRQECTFEESFRKEDEDRIKNDFPWILESHTILTLSKIDFCNKIINSDWILNPSL